MMEQSRNAAQRSKELISIEEYNTHISTLNFFDTTRNSLLTFSFTAVLTLLGVVIATNNRISPFVCLIPYFLIIPFAARISYYRLASARINTFLKIFTPERTVLNNGSTIVPEYHGKMYPIIAWLINHEMVLLAFATGGTYCYQYWNYFGLYSWWDILLIFVPLPFIVAVFLISDSTFSYKDLCETYEPKWKTYFAKVNRQNEEL